MENVKTLRSEYADTGVYAVLMLAVLGGIFSLAVVLVTPELPSWLTWQTALAGVWFLVGGALAVVLYFIISNALDRARLLKEDEFAQREHERHMEELKAQPPPATTPPAPAPVVSPPILTEIGATQAQLIGDFIDKRDVRWFTEQIVATKDWTARKWEGVTLPYGYRITNKDTNGKGEPTSYARLIQLYVDCEIIVDRVPPQTGRLAITDVDRALRLLEMSRKPAIT